MEKLVVQTPNSQTLSHRLLYQIARTGLRVIRVVPATPRRRITNWFRDKVFPQFPDNKMHIEGVWIKIPGSFVGKFHYLEAQSHLIEYLKSHVRQGMVFVDVGTSLGLFSLLAAQMVGPDGHVHSIEPARDSLELLKENIKLNHIQNITLHACAASAAPGEMTLYVRGNISGGNSLFAEHLDTLPVVSSYLVTIRPLDDLVQGPIDVVKIDVEGAELDVLAGMQRILAQNPKLRIILEWNPELQERTGHSPTKLPETLLAHGFDLTIISPFTTHLASADDIHRILPKVIEQTNHTVDLAAVRG